MARRVNLDHINFHPRALPVIEIRYGFPTDPFIPRPTAPQWVVECRSCWGSGDEVQYLGSFPAPDQAAHHGDLHIHTGRLGTGA